MGKKVLPSEFTQLKKGGPQNGFVTECIVYQTGASFKANNGEPYLRKTFKGSTADLRRMLLGGRYVLTEEVSRFEAAFAEYLGVRHVRGVNSGTDALVLAFYWILLGAPTL